MNSFNSQAWVERIRRFKKRPGCSAGGALHVFTDDGNERRSDMEFCLEEARRMGDKVAESIAKDLLELTNKQRERIYCALHNIEEEEEDDEQ